jgi:hypothetical protein
VRTIFDEKTPAAARAASARAGRLRKLCAAVVLDVALFAPSAPAHADDAPAGPAATVASVAADADAASAAVAAQASAIVGDISTGPSQPSAQPSAPAATTGETGSTSGQAGGISAAPPPPPEQGAAPTVSGAAASAVGAATTAATAVVAAAKQVVSAPQAPMTAVGSSPAPNTAPAAGTPDAGRQYQQNGGRYQPDNSAPISSGIGSIPPTESSPQPTSVPGQNSTPNSGRIPLPKCLEDLPDSVAQSACADALSQLPDVRSVLGTASSNQPTAHPHPHRAHRTKVSPHPAVPAPATARASDPLPASTSVQHSAVVVVAVPTAKHTTLVSARHEQPDDAATHRAQPARARGIADPAPVTRQPKTRLREAAGSESTDETAPSLFLVAILLGLVTVAVALGSIGLRRGAVLTAVATRLRSKGLSSAAKVRADTREDPPPAIRYRE